MDKNNKLSDLRIHVGSGNFDVLTAVNNVFVDKSMFIQEFLEENQDEVILIARPQRWGKSLSINMLKCFLGIELDAQEKPLPPERSFNHKLFAGGEIVTKSQPSRVVKLKTLKIMRQCPDLVSRYQRQHPVVSISFNDVKGSSYQAIEAGIRKNVVKLYREHKYLKQYIQPERALLEDSQKRKLQDYLTGTISRANLEDSLRFLSELLYRHFGKTVYILVDAYDTPMQHAYLASQDDPAEFDRILKLLTGMLGAALKDNPYLSKGLLTGVFGMAKNSWVATELGHIRTYTLLDKRFSTAYGFTQREVDKMLREISMSTLPAEIKRWYNGYQVGDQVLYHPWSVMSYLASKGVLDHYWLDGGGKHPLMEAVLRNDQMQEHLQNLIVGGTLTIPVIQPMGLPSIEKTDELLSLLLFNGYLKPTAVDTQGEVYQLSIPNYEAQYACEQGLLGWLAQQLEIDLPRYHHLMNLLATGQATAFEKYLQELMHCSTRFQQSSPKMVELFQKGFMLGLPTSLLGYYNSVQGVDEPDRLLIPKVSYREQALAISYKLGQASTGLAALAGEGLAQLVAKGYATQAQTHGDVSKLLQVCLAWGGREVALQYERLSICR